ncbi:hypothetical protein [Kitasatospora sp. NBC_00374]|uniref:hypothetical protein n=1 Tax=Kitasatospora sp. NBC_00374 TaxID=2975964 RepID=UPI00352E8D76
MSALRGRSRASAPRPRRLSNASAVSMPRTATTSEGKAWTSSPAAFAAATRLPGVWATSTGPDCGPATTVAASGAGWSSVLQPARGRVPADGVAAQHGVGVESDSRWIGVRPEEVRLRTGPGDYIFVPPFVPHREENPDPGEEAVVVIARSTQEAVVVNLPGLYALGGEK